MLKIRLRRMGKTHAPFYRVVVSDSRRTPIASAVEEVGHYNPRPTPPDVQLNVERVRYWQDQGALLSPTVKKLLHRVEHGDLANVAVVPGADEAAGEAKKAAETTESKAEETAQTKTEAKPEAAAPEAEAAASDDEESAGAASDADDADDSEE